MLSYRTPDGVSSGNMVNILACTLWSIMLKIIIDACDLSCPMVNLEICTNTPGWFTADIIEMVNQKRELTNIGRKNILCGKL